MEFKRLFLDVIAAACVCISINSFAATYGGGNGDANNPYQIWTAAQLNTIGANSGDWGKSFALMADVNMAAYTGTQYKVIGDQVNYFTGTFEGNGHIIRNLSYAASNGVNYIGLFGWISEATIRNVGVENVNISTNGKWAGGLAGTQSSSATVLNCHSSGSISAAGAVGGLIGEVSGSVSNCYSSATVCASATAAPGSFGGGLVGRLMGTIANCYSTGWVRSTDTTAGHTYAGGLVGQSIGVITNSYSSGDVNAIGVAGAGSYVAYAGGLAGFQDCATSSRKINKCYSTGRVAASGYAINRGGLLGYKNGSYDGVTGCFWDTESSGMGASAGGASVIGKTTAEMKTLATFTGAAWDFTNETTYGSSNYWRMCGDGIDYPRLNWQSGREDIACPDGVNFTDFAALAEQWLAGDCASSNNNCGRADMNVSGGVNVSDLVILVGNWLSGA